jgi:hypothetical protein
LSWLSLGVLMLAGIKGHYGVHAFLTPKMQRFAIQLKPFSHKNQTPRHKSCIFRANQQPHPAPKLEAYSYRCPRVRTRARRWLDFKETQNIQVY